MALGAVQYVVECVPDLVGSVSAAPCVDISAVHYAPQIVQAYVLDALSASVIDSLAVPFDAALASQFFGFAFVTVIGIYLVAYKVGQIIQPIERHVR